MTSKSDNNRPSRQATRERAKAISDEGLAGLAGFRRALRQFLAFSETAVSSAGVSSQQYQAMLAIRAHPEQQLSMKDLAAELLLKPHGAVQLINRLQAQGLVERHESLLDKRSVLLRLSTRGSRLIGVLASEHLAELLVQRPLLVDSLEKLKTITGSASSRV